ncbi:heme oxygenase (biliverdin-producing) [Luteimicrobium subarcticum]|uniref:Heme oxygenase n=1 Tax=Luteimicrobium subarcticum TaxID=620910 RepID=A0A2M8WSB1_9MICO|nr:biliverdin-producing heme oxygenase [Luteimicrobium subarcticum]PJI93726.1 heme oxygenase [Luteimicrobium subarcticum]
MTAVPVATWTDTHVPLSLLLREGTREEHERAEASGFVGSLLEGRLDVAAYADLAAQQLAVYRALETESAVAVQDPRGANLVFDELTRTPSIERDLDFLLGPDWSERITLHPATLEYVTHLQGVGADLPRYAAHAYTRYLGDLSGGQIIKRMLERHYDLGPAGLAFYTFDEIPKAKPFKDLYRERLDALALTADEADRAVDEACVAFRLNAAMFADLGTVHC